MSHDPEAAVGLSSRWAKMPVIISSGYIVAEFVSALRCDAIADRKSSIFMVDGIIVVPFFFMSPCRIAFFPVLMHQVSSANLRIALNAFMQNDLSEYPFGKTLEGGPREVLIGSLRG